MAEILGSAVASESVGRIFSILSGNPRENGSGEDNAERLEFAVLKIHSVVAVSDDWQILHQPLLTWKARLKCAAKEGDRILRANRRRSTERQRNEGTATSLQAISSARKRVARAAKRFMPFGFGRREDDDADQISDATVRRFERLATVADEFFRYVQFGGRPKSLMVSFRAPTESLLAGKTLEFSFRNGSRDALLLLHPCDGEAGGGLKDVVLFLSYDDTAVWEKNVKLYVVFQLLENTDILDMVMSALQLLPPQFGDACVTTREFVREVLPTQETSYSIASSVLTQSVSSAWRCHRSSMDNGSIGRPRLPLPIIRVDVVYFAILPHKDSSVIPTNKDLPFKLVCHITPHLMPERYYEHYEQIGPETLQELELLRYEGTPAYTTNWWCPRSSTFLSVEPELSMPLPTLEHLFLTENSCKAV